MDLEGTWQRVGVIAEIASCFQRLGLSIDMLASSQTHVTVALDPEANPLSEPLLEALLRELEEVCSPRLERPAAAVSLVGTSIADVLHELGPLLENLEHENVNLLSHAANDLSLTIVVDQEASDRLVQRLHDKIFGGLPADGDLGPTWAQLRTETAGQAGGA
jgi:diaminopimelate decarboxylase/aspartate kinase